MIQTQRVGELASPEPRAHRAGLSGEILPSPGETHVEQLKNIYLQLFNMCFFPGVSW